MCKKQKWGDLVNHKHKKNKQSRKQNSFKRVDDEMIFEINLALIPDFL